MLLPGKARDTSLEQFLGQPPQRVEAHLELFSTSPAPGFPIHNQYHYHYPFHNCRTSLDLPIYTADSSLCLFSNTESLLTQSLRPRRPPSSRSIFNNKPYTMAYAPATPQRPLPGAYFATPAASRFTSGPPARQPLFSQGGRPPAPGPNPNDGNPNPQSRQAPPPTAITPVSRAARTISDVLSREAQFPEIDSYIRRECWHPALEN